MHDEIRDHQQAPRDGDTERAVECQQDPISNSGMLVLPGASNLSLLRAITRRVTVTVLHRLNITRGFLTASVTVDARRLTTRVLQLFSIVCFSMAMIIAT